MPPKKSGDIRRRWEMRVLVALPAVWILFAAVEGYVAIQMTLAAAGHATTPASASVDRVRLLVIGFGALLALAFGAGLALAVTRPMRELLHKIQHRLRGDAAVSMTAGNELRQLSNAFDDMLLSFDKFVSDTHIVDGMPLGILVVDKADVIGRVNAEVQRLFPAHRALQGSRVGDICPPGMDHRLNEALTAVRDKGTPVEISAEILLGPEPDPGSESKRLVTLYPTSFVGEVVIAICDLGRLAMIRGQIQRVDQLAALGAHVASVAHEIGGGLMGIQTLLDALAPGAPEDRRLLDKLRAEVERAGRLLTEIRMFGQANARDRVLCNMGRLVEETLWTVEPRYVAKRLTVDRRLNHELPPVLVDRDRVVQAIVNVVANAFEVTPTGGNITVVLERVESATLVRVANTGSFIAPEQRDKIFTLFYTTKRGGSGFGLPQARRALVDHGGDIEVTSTVDRGTEFVLRFPDQPPISTISLAAQQSAAGGLAS